MSNYIFVDVEARGISPIYGTMTEFGAVHEQTRQTFHGVLYASTPDPACPAVPIVGKLVSTPQRVAREFAEWLTKVGGGERAVFVSDNPAYDFMWIAGLFDLAGMENPFGHSGRRLSDFWAGLNNNWTNTQKWKKFRITPHDHNPVNDAMGNVEAFQELKRIAKLQLLAGEDA